jgi:hypothetical protein
VTNASHLWWSDIMVPSEEAVSRCLKDIKPLNVKPDRLSLLVSRQFLTDMYGVSPMSLLATSKSGRRLIFPTPDVNPDMPTSPGNPGLLSSCRKGIVEFTWSLFSRNQTSRGASEHSHGCASIRVVRGAETKGIRFLNVSYRFLIQATRRSKYVGR